MTEKPTQLTPMLRQYHEIKKQYPGTLLFFRLGDFYELFYDDALIGAREMEITLTARQKERGNPIPMCGIPYHAATNYISKLIKKGYRVAICDQTEPAQATKLVRREVIRVITPGTTLEGQLLDGKQSNYLAAIYGAGEGMGIAILDLSTGEFLATQFKEINAWLKIQEQLSIFSPKEVLSPKSLQPLLQTYFNPTNTSTKGPEETSLSTPPDSLLSPATSHLSKSNLSPNEFRDNGKGLLTLLDDWLFGYDHAESLLRVQLGVASLDGYGFNGKQFAVCAAGAIVHYVLETQRTHSPHLNNLSYFEQSDALLLDAPTIQNLEIFPANNSANEKSLLKIIDETVTSMGGRLLRSWLRRPLINRGEIEARLNAVDELKTSAISRDRLRTHLTAIADLERLASKLTYGRATARDLKSLEQSLRIIPQIRQLLAGLKASLFLVLLENLDDLASIRDLIAEAIADEPPATLNEVGIIKAGYNDELDELRNLAQSGKSYIAALEARERSRTGISSLKIKFNNVFGYFIEIANTHRSKIPADYERKQTLVSSERYTTLELKEYEVKVLGAEDRILQLEAQIFTDIRNQILQELKRIQTVAKILATLDCLAGLASVAAKNNYRKPVLHDSDEIKILGGRHPIVESLGDRFIPNDTYLNNSTDRLLIITGPNMGGKSVFLKQTALIVVLAQLGSFVPATEAYLPIVDRIFTRVGASDNLASGRSTFMVEMMETANILNTATARSLVLLDEVGRGTATFDGLSLAWSIAEYLHDHTQHSAKTLFATHYHELTELAKLRPGVKNCQVAVAESGADIVFLRKVIPGSASKSYGLEVARIAGLPQSVVNRAREILQNLEQNELDVSGKPKFARHLKKRSTVANQLSFLDDPQETDNNT